MVNHPNRSKFNHKVEYPVAVEEQVNDKWIQSLFDHAVMYSGRV